MAERMTSEPSSEQARPAQAQPTVTGVLADKRPGLIVVDIPGFDYEMHLRVETQPAAEIGQKITGTVHAKTKRVDVVPAGGRYVEPVYGRPRRVQGRVVGGELGNNRLYVKAGPTLICTLGDFRQKAGDFAIGQLVSFDVEAGSQFEVIESAPHG